MMERGAIYNPARAGQLHDFTGLRYGKITPTNIDGAIDFGGKAFVVIETKVAGTPLPTGQRIFLERMNDALNSDTTKALTLIAEHTTHVSQPINVASCIVTEYRNDACTWIPIIARVTVLQAINTFLKRLGLDERYKIEA